MKGGGFAPGLLVAQVGALVAEHTLEVGDGPIGAGAGLAQGGAQGGVTGGGVSQHAVGGAALARHHLGGHQGHAQLAHRLHALRGALVLCQLQHDESRHTQHHDQHEAHGNQPEPAAKAECQVAG